MPWGYPWSLDDPRHREDTAWSFRCAACAAELFHYTPHCPQCGARQPGQARAFGTTGRQYRRVWRPNEVGPELDRCHGWTAEVGTFHAGHAELELRAWSEGDSWALIYCAGAGRIEVSPGRWRCAFELSVADGERGRVFTLTDGVAGLRVVCGMLSVYVPEGPA